MSGRVRATAVLLTSALAAAVLTLTGTRMAASQGPTLVALEAAGDVPAREPFDPFWNRLPAVDLPLSAQQTVPPMGGSRLTLTARAVHDGERLYVLVEWPDASPERSVAAVQDFTDAAAVQFPAPAGTRIPAFCMGDPEATVNIWQWKAAWQADLEGGMAGTKDRYPNAVADLYPFHEEEIFYPGRAAGNPFSLTDRTTAVDNLVAAGFGTLTPDEGAEVQGWGAWLAGRWRVVFERALSIGREGNVDLAVRGATDVAFAVWDGAAGERDGQKSVANFVRLEVSGEAMPGGPSPWPTVLLVGFLVLMGLIAAVAIPLIVARAPRSGR